MRTPARVLMGAVFAAQLDGIGYTSTADTIRPVRPSYPPPLRPQPPEAGRADTVGRSQLEGMQPAADRIRNPYTPPEPQECRRPEQLAGMGASAQPPPDPPTSTASTPWILPENGDSWTDGRHLHRAPIRPVRPFLFSTKQRLFLFSARKRKKGRKSVGGRASKTAPPKKRARCQNSHTRVGACARRTAPEPAGRMGAGSQPADTPRRRIRRG